MLSGEPCAVDQQLAAWPVRQSSLTRILAQGTHSTQSAARVGACSASGAAGNHGALQGSAWCRVRVHEIACLTGATNEEAFLPVLSLHLLRIWWKMLACCCAPAEVSPRAQRHMSCSFLTVQRLAPLKYLIQGFHADKMHKSSILGPPGRWFEPGLDRWEQNLHQHRLVTIRMVQQLRNAKMHTMQHRHSHAALTCSLLQISGSILPLADATIARASCRMSPNVHMSAKTRTCQWPRPIAHNGTPHAHVHWQQWKRQHSLMKQC